MAKSKKKISTNIFKSYKNPSTIEKLLGVLLVLFIGTMVLKYRTGKNTITEGFEESKEVITKKVRRFMMISMRNFMIIFFIIKSKISLK